VGDTVNAARIDRALAVLGHLASHHEGRSVKHISDDLGLPMSSAHDLLQALVEIGAVRLAGPRVYALGPRAVSMALTITDSLKLRPVAHPFLVELAEEVNENTYLAVRNGDDVVYADLYETAQPLSVVMQLGSSRPLLGSSVGKLITAFNADLETRVLSSSRLEPLTPFTLINRDRLRADFAAIRQRCYSVSDGESVEGIIGLSTPIFDATGAVVAAVHISAPRGRLAPDRRPLVIEQMLVSANRISGQLGAPAAVLPDEDIEPIRRYEEQRVPPTS
jgi:DNA-binding IclR family transcriptional regulator